MRITTRQDSCAGMTPAQVEREQAEREARRARNRQFNEAYLAQEREHAASLSAARRMFGLASVWPS